MRRALHALFLVLALLFTQAGLAVHAAGHLAAGHPGGEHSLPADRGCDLCVAYAQLAGSAPLPETPKLPLLAARHALPPARTAPAAAFLVFPARARAPPVFS